MKYQWTQEIYDADPFVQFRPVRRSPRVAALERKIERNLISFARQRDRVRAKNHPEAYETG